MKKGILVALLLGGLALLVLTGIDWTSRSEPVEPARASEAGIAGERKLVSSSRAIPAPVAGPLERPPERPAAPDRAQEQRLSVPNDFAASISATGVLLDGAGPGEVTEDGFPCQVLLSSGDGELTRFIDLPRGSWAGRLPLGRAFEVVAVQNAKQGFGFAASGALAEESPTATIAVQQSDAWTLHARDADSGEQLQHVTLTALHASIEESIGFLGLSQARMPQAGTKELVSDVTSPVQVSEPLAAGFYWVSAPGYAAASFQRHGFQRDLEIRLQPSGGLILEPAPELGRPDGLTVRVQRPNGEQVLSQAVPEEGVIRIPDLASGEYEVSVVYETGTHGEIETFRALASVPAGDWVRVMITPGEPEEFAALKVTLVLPDLDREREDWSVTLFRSQGQQSVYVTQEDLSLWNTIEGTTGWERDFLRLARGSYEIRVHPTERVFSVVLDRPEQSVVLEMSDAALVRATCLLDGAGSSGYELEWGYRDSPYMSYRSGIDSRTLEATICCEPRPIRLQVVGASSASEIVEVSPEAGRETFVSLSPTSSALGLLHLSLWEAGGHASADSSTLSDLVLERIDGEGRLLAISFGGEHGAAYGTSIVFADWSQAAVVVSPPGRYRLSIPSIDRVVEVEIGPEESRLDILLD